jgi:hypothetical protein
MTIPKQIVHVTIYARQADKPQEDDCLSWLISVSTNNKSAYTNLYLKDPLDPEQKANCRWYLEQYVQQSPFSITRAQEAAECLQNYQKELLKQLRLMELVRSVSGNYTAKKLSLFIEVLEETLESAGSGRTVHQLHWELLEDATIWDHDNIEILVRRSINHSDRPLSSNYRIKSLPKINGPGSSINILLIVARDISKKPAAYSDVSPSMASAILSRLRLDLRATGSPLQLNVEIVRPGTLASLEQHLERSQTVHGSGYFHIVHFDLHGGVHMRKGSKVAYLYFASPDSDGTKPEQASVVGTLLNRYNVSYVVLNSCESARANSGDDANVAKTFEKEGIQYVLAMSFKISSNAAEIFLRSFYNHVLVGGSSFSDAARMARDALRRSPTRHARFGLQLQLLDWFVPVIYFSRQESVLTSTQREIIFPTLEIKDVFEGEELTTLGESPLSLGGRDFDLLRLEKALLANYALYLHGPAGAGKTALLQYACSLWIETSFVDAVIFLDFERNEIHSVSELAVAIIQGLLGTAHGQEYRSQLWSMPSASQTSYNDSAIASIIVDLLFKLRVVIIFDGLHVSHTMFGPELVIGSLTETALSDINEFLRRIVRSQLDSSYRGELYLIFAGHRSDWRFLSQHFSIGLEPALFELRGLELADSIELAQSILRKSGQDVNNWSLTDLDSLELVIDLLQGLPSALLEILPLVAELGVPWHDFYDSIHGDVMRYCPWLDSGTSKCHTIFFELHRLCEVISDDILALLLPLSIYWKAGICSGSFVVHMISSGLCADEDRARLTIQLGCDRGYLDINELGLISWIHPLFTIYARHFAFVSAVLPTFKLDQISTSEWAAILPTIKPDQISTSVWTEEVHRRSRSIKASQLTLSLLSVKIDGVPVLEEEAAYIVSFLEDLNSQWVLQDIVYSIQGIDFGALRSIYIGGQHNGFTCMNICVSQGSAIPIKEWPLNLFTRLSDFNRAVGTTAEIMLSASRFEELLDCFIKLNGGFAFEPKYLDFALHISSYLAIIHQNETSIPFLDRRHHEFIQLALDIITASETKYGEITALWSLFEKGYVLRVQTCSLMEKRSGKKALETWKKFSEVDEAFFNQLESESQATMEGRQIFPNKKIADALINELSKDKEEAEAMRKRLASVLALRWEGANCERRKELSKCMEVIAETIMSDDLDCTEKLSAAFEKFNPGFIKLAAVGQSMGFTGFDCTRDWPENNDLAAQYLRFSNPLRRLTAIEAARDSGNWVSAIKHHRELMIEACQNLDFDESLEHENALSNIYAKDPLFSSELQKLEIVKRYILSCKTYYNEVTNGSPGSSALQILSSLDEMVKLMEGTKLCTQETLDTFQILRDFWPKEAESDSPNLVIGAAGDMRESAKRLNRKMVKVLRTDNPELLKEFMVTGHKALSLTKEIDDTEESRDPARLNAALETLEELEKLSVAKFGPDFVNADIIPKNRELIRWKRDYFTSVLAWEDAIMKRNFEEAMAQLQECTMLKQSEPSDSGINPEALISRYKTTESLYWNHLFDTARMSQSEPKAIGQYEHLLNLYENGIFSHLKPEELEGTINAAKSNMLLSKMRKTFETHAWQECMEHCDAWVALATRELTSHPRRPDIGLDTKEACEIAYYDDEQLKAILALDFNRAAEFAVKIQEVYVRQRQTPEVVRKIALKLTWGMVNEGQKQVIMAAEIVETLGPVLGRLVIRGPWRVVGWIRTSITRSGGTRFGIILQLFVVRLKVFGASLLLQTLWYLIRRVLGRMQAGIVVLVILGAWGWFLRRMVR